MGYANAYRETQAVTLDGNRAFEELYVRLARWTAQAAESSGTPLYEQLIDKCVMLIGLMDRVIDVEHGGRIALAILSLHRFAIGALIKAKQEGVHPDLAGLPPVFYEMSDIFRCVREKSLG
ncbi:MAG TPA: hypothetical protein VFB15_07555 [Candidatus Binataceae bacterium]|jgi:flagellin-specific chaperone FliS|nr:hypothetical protein [Candidatus Binataceae bacterium]